MNLREQFNAALKDAMRAREQKRVSTLRLVLAALKDRDIANRSEANREGIGDDEILSLLAKMIKQREESAAAFEAGGRPELAASEREEIVIIREFQPAQMSETDTRSAVAAIIAETGASAPKDMGKVMTMLKAHHAGRMDFAKASAIAKDLLTPK
ncbi:MAG TPA: GatB/YqeY domain-containing protein [Rhizomicrobium sp.]|jgi:uncharacterized protein YqeY